ncbi:CDP-alcohol phosphatidyltransferase family protein [Phreatobacter stygius]|uniref:CDP-alcohol phosphatidyltransferase family protein n=1 Tax=Phreatobacter stygius TaxID=1940610 RepID=A0A4D7B6X2_9HYPH|nr:CDP-alcohol phosphatidyltransferase family protein [Phreatobacter stygius]QCI66060.1 CDP-alcohol phosphatidyltransferase family protein [Phreatobacter stygius]
MMRNWAARLLGSLEQGVSVQDIGRSASFTAGLSRIASRLARTGVTPNTLTLMSLLPAVASGIAAANGLLGWAGVLLLVSGAFDLLDGPLARLTGTATRFGALLDSTVDRVSDAAPLLGLTILYSNSGWLAVLPALALLAAYTVSYVRARCEGLKVALPPLWMRRGDRMILLVLSLFLGSLVPWLALGGVALIALLSALAAADALRVARHVIDAGGGRA